jgi:hypothetical protein
MIRVFLVKLKTPITSPLEIATVIKPLPAGLLDPNFQLKVSGVHSG